ncbi:MAG: cytochrome c [Terrimicrobiaceae bacterium]|nr:cytochrome c [Terrimicrobiaceae bacterium]
MSQENLPPEEDFKESELASDMNVAKVHGSILRERAEPRDGYEPVPLWLITVFFTIIFWGGLYLALNSGGFRADVFDPTLVSWSGGGAVADAGPPDPMVVGKRVFTQNCVVCHQTTGLGVAGQFPPLAGSEWVLGGDWHGDNHLVKLMLQGLQGPIQVKGNTYNNAMPPWAQLTDEQIAAVLTYIRNEWGNSAPPITIEFVAQIRQETGARTEPWTQRELQAIPPAKVPAAGAAPPEAPADAPAPAPGTEPPADAPPADAAAPAAPAAASTSDSPAVPAA